MTNLQEQIKRYAADGMPSDEIASMMQVEHSLVKLALGPENPVLTEDISDKEFNDIKDAVKEIAFNAAEDSSIRLNALKFMWDRKRPLTSSGSNHVPNFMLVLNQQINNARERTGQYVSEFTAGSGNETVIENGSNGTQI